MRIIEPNARYNVPTRRPRKKHKLSVFMVVVFIIFFVLCLISYTRPLPEPQVNTFQLSTVPEKQKVKWPSYGESAIAGLSGELLAKSDNQNVSPTASIAKVILALSVLKKQPINLGELGPKLKINKTDIAIYDDYFAKNGSVVKVKVGDKIPRYHILEAVLMASANNLSDTLARNIFGSIQNYSKFANSMLKDMGLKNTIVIDASGFNPGTKSTAEDLVLIGQQALNNPIIRKIVGQKSVTLPAIGKIDNRNIIVGTNGILGIKTGNTDQAGGCYLFARQKDISGNKITLVGAIMRADNSEQAMNDSLTFSDSIFAGYKHQLVASSGQQAGYLKTGWGAQIPLLTSKNIIEFGWAGKSSVSTISIAKDSRALKKNDIVGEIKTDNQSKASIVLAADVPKPSIFWRSFRWL